LLIVYYTLGKLLYVRCSMSQIKAFILHLDRAVAREEQVKKLQQTLPITSEVVAAIDAHDLSVDQMAHVYRRHLYKPAYPFILSKNEVACFLSHRKIWAMIVEQGCAGGLILEDDAHLNGDFAEAFALASTFMTPRSFIRFPHHRRERGEVIASKGDIRLILPKVVGLGQVACLISREVAAQLLDRTEFFDRPIDVLLQMFWLTKVRPLSITPSGIEEISQQLGGSTLHQKRTMGTKLRREILRPLYRWRLAHFSRKYSTMRT